MIGVRVDCSGGLDIVAQLTAVDTLDELFDRIDAGDIELTGNAGIISVLVKEVRERGLRTEKSSHLGYG